MESQIRLVFRKIKDLLYDKSLTIYNYNAAVFILAKLLLEKKEPNLMEKLLNAIENNNRFCNLHFSFLNVSNFEIPLVSMKVIKSLESVELTAVSPKLLIRAIDNIFLMEQVSYHEPKIPRWVADLMTKLASVDESDTVLNPYNSHGEILSAVLLNSPETNIIGYSDNLHSSLWSVLELVAIGQVIPNVQLSHHLFSEPPLEKSYSRIICSPFFGRMTSKENHYLRMYGHHLPCKTSRIEDFYLLLAIHKLKENGRAVLLMPDRILFAQDRFRLRNYIMEHVNIKGIISLEQGALAPYSNTKANIVILDKNSDRDKNTFMSIISTNKMVEDSFNCLELNNVDKVVKEFQRWDKTKKAYSITHSWIVSPDELSPENFTVTRYMPHELLSEFVEDPPYTVYKLIDITNLIRNGKTYKKNGSSLFYVETLH
jgi:hypothetical protein